MFNETLSNDVVSFGSRNICSLTVNLLYSIHIINYTDLFVEKMKEVFALQKLLTFFQQIIWQFFDISI